MIKVLIADDHQLLIDGLRPLLERHSDVEVVGVAHDGLTATDLANQTKPDIILMDISMPKLNGIDATRKVLGTLPDTRIIILSMHADRRFIQEALRAGARGYILKESAASELIQAVSSVHKGELYFSASVRDKVLKEYVERIKDGTQTPPSPLSSREREVLQILAEGNTTKDAAAILNVSVKTIESHRKQIMDKLDLHSIAALTKYAIRAGITQLD